MTELQQLLADRLNDLDRRRERTQQPLVYWLVGTRKTGAIAPFNTVRGRQGDADPANALHWSYSPGGLHDWYLQATVANVKNTRRWK